MKGFSKNKKGISLIVLVITMIVMIILAAAIILSLNGSGIIDKANEAKTSSDLANAKHVAALAKAEWELKTDKTGDFKTYAENKLKDAGFKVGIDGFVTVSEDGAVNEVYVGDDARKAIIPEGFTVSTNKLEDTVTEGLVIKDVSGNEFVWVPVDVPTEKTFDEIFQRTITYKPDEGITRPSNYAAKEPYKTSTYTDEETEYLAMRASVEVNGGFYIARYEAGFPEGKTSNTVTTSDVPVSKKGAKVWGSICWGTSMTEIGTEGAVYKARQMYKNSESVVSTLCYCVQWDATLRFIAMKDADYPTYSSGKGYYVWDENGVRIEGRQQMLQTAGYYAINNIYDMAGNAREWTMEAYSTDHRIIRGGFLNSSGAEDPASVRHYAGAEESRWFYWVPRYTLY